MRLGSILAAGTISLVAVAGLAGPAFAATPAALAVDKCAVHVNIVHPHAGQRETLAVTSTRAKTTVQVKIKYKTVSHTWKFVTPASTKTTFQFGVGDPTKNYKVTLTGTVIGAPAGYKTGFVCSTSFVPE